VEIGTTALVVVDMQNGFVRAQSRHVVPVVVDLVRRWQHAGGATIFTRFINQPGSAFERLIGWSLVATSPETDIVDELAPYVARATAVVDKPAYTLFTKEGVDAVAAGGWTDLAICGLATESCVTKTAADAFEYGYTPWLIVDACGSHAGPEAHNAGVLVTRRFIGDRQIITTADMPIPALPATA
jgi:nicotinamidase-related amidase